jgi:hypothetical protein
MAMAALALMALATVLALGEYGYLYPLTLHLPMVGVFRSAARYVVLVQFGMAICGAIACADLIALASGRTVSTRSQRLALLLLPVGSALVVAAAMWLRARPALAPEIVSHIGPVGPAMAGIALMATAALLFAAAASGRRAALPVLLLFAVLDQGYYGVSFLRSPVPPVPFDALVQGQAMPPDVSADRVQADNNILMLSGVRLAGGYAAFRPIGQLDELSPERLRLAGVRWVQLGSSWAPQRTISPEHTDWRGQLEPGPNTTDALGRPSLWARVLRPMPRAWFVTNEVVSDNVARDVVSIDIESTALVTEHHGLTSGIPGAATFIRDQAGRLELDVNASSRQLLVVSERWHEGWRAVVDGRREPVIRSNGDFIGAVVDAGHHTIEFHFWPASLQRGLWCSALGLTLLMAGYALSRRRAMATHP